MKDKLLPKMFRKEENKKMSGHRRPMGVTRYRNSSSLVDIAGFGFEQRGIDSEIWVPKEGIASTESLLRVGESAGNRVAKWPRLNRMFLNI